MKRARYFGQERQLEFCAQDAVRKGVIDAEARRLDELMAPQTVIEELRKRLRECQAARFRVEAELAIVREERVQLAARLKNLSGGLYKLWKGESSYLDRIRCVVYCGQSLLRDWLRKRWPNTWN